MKGKVAIGAAIGAIIIVALATVLVAPADAGQQPERNLRQELALLSTDAGAAGELVQPAHPASPHRCFLKLQERFGTRTANNLWPWLRPYTHLWCPPANPHANPTPTPLSNPDVTPVSTPAPTPAPTPVLTPPPTQAPTPTPTPAPAPTPAPTPTLAPTPVPTPSPTPAPPADLQVTSVGLSSPTTATRSVSFTVSGNANLVNAGPTDNMPAVITLTLSSSVPCSFNAAPIVVNHSGMPIGQNVFVSRRWTVTCNSAGPVTFTLNASVAPAAFAGSDPDLSNNAGVATDITDVLP